MSNATTLRISARQLADAAYRALRVVGIPSGAAADAARDAVELERRRGRGLEVLDRILNAGPPPPSTTCEAHGTSMSVDARGGSALLLAVPLVAFACDLTPSPLTIHRLAHCAALEPALLRRARAEHRRFELTQGDGTTVLGVDPAESAIDAGWCAAWELPLDVRLTVGEAGTSHSAAPVGSSADRPLMVAAQCWERLSERAAAYLV
ncbi:MAG: hypothetical protein JO304_05170 [Solirubrobacterales bacterium]|nr:hypothetical protein [Solirubrobacterales bacterium]